LPHSDPAHGAGSLCGKNLSTDTVSTIGVQRIYNYALQPMDRARFIEIITADQPDTPAYFTYDAVLNSKERQTLDKALERELQALSLDQVMRTVGDGAQFLDTRDPADFSGAHVRGTVSVGLGGKFATWCGTVLDHARPVVLVAEPGREVEAATRLGRIGFDTVAGYLDGGMQPLEAAPELVERIERITAASLAEQLGSADPPLVVDVRTEGEWRHENIAGAINVPLSRLQDQLQTIALERRIVVHCASDYRATIAASILRGAGAQAVTVLVGGIAAWEAQRLQVGSFTTLTN
jgi:rhodanese-related sulfurtransferase